MKIPRQIPPQRETQRRPEPQETSEAAAVADVQQPVNLPIGPSAPVDSGRGAAAAAASRARARSPVGPEMAIFASLDAGALRSTEGAAFTSADIGRLVARLTEEKAQRPSVFGPAVDVLTRLKRLMDMVESRRQAQRSADSRRIEPIERQSRDTARREP